MSAPSTPDPALPPDTERAVRRLLAEARVTDPLPADVAERLDATLAALRSPAMTTAMTTATTAPTSTATTAPVVALASRRRRVLPGLLAAAAAVVVAGVVAPQVLPLGATSGNDESASSAQDSSGGDQVDSDAPENGASSESQRSKEPTPPTPMVDTASSVRLRPRHLEADLLALRRHGATADLVAAEVGCPAATADGILATYAGEPAYVLLAAPTEAGQRAEVLSCADARLLDAAVLPAR